MSSQMKHELCVIEEPVRKGHWVRAMGSRAQLAVHLTSGWFCMSHLSFGLWFLQPQPEEATGQGPETMTNDHYWGIKSTWVLQPAFKKKPKRIEWKTFQCIECNKVSIIL